MTSVLLIGCGKMGGALLAGWFGCGMTSADVTVVEPALSLRQGAAAAFGVATFDAVTEIPDSVRYDVVVLAVKPQTMAEMLPGVRRFAGSETVFLSIAAGKSISWLAESLGSEAAVVRSMPNIPAAVRRGITVACASASVSAIQRQHCDALLAAVGDVAWVDDEGHMDAVTAVSGSGPAYVFLMAESLAKAGIAAGLPPDLAATLARTTVSGAGELLRLSTESPATLRQNVTSPGGTTAAALEVLMADDGILPLLTTAVVAATRRSRELNS